MVVICTDLKTSHVRSQKSEINLDDERGSV